jgi:hypothetical protein
MANSSSFFSGGAPDFSSAFSSGKYDNPWFGPAAKPMSENTWDTASKYSKNAFTDPYDFDKRKDDNIDKWKNFGEAVRMAGQRLNDYKNNPYGGSPSYGGGGATQLFDNYALAYPQTYQPFTVGGESGNKSGVGGAIGEVAGAALGTFVFPGLGTAAGAGLGGAAGRGIGSMFG